MDSKVARTLCAALALALTSCKPVSHSETNEATTPQAAPVPESTPALRVEETRPDKKEPEIFALVRNKFFDRMPEILSLPGIDGVTLYTSLARIEPQDGAYDWKDLDAAVEAATNAGRPIHLAVLGGRWTPDWVFQKGAKKIEWTHSTTLVDSGTTQARAPLPWDPVYLGIMSDMATELGRRYGSNPLVTGIQITGPALANGLETNFVISEEVAKANGFTPKAYIQAWVTMGEAFGKAFPDKQLYIALSNEIAGHRDEKVPRAIRSQLEERLGSRLSIMVFYLTHEPWFTKGNPAVEIWREGDQTGKAAQMIAIYSEKKLPPQALTEAVRRAGAMKARFVEIWIEDLLLPDYRNAVNTPAQ